MNLSNNKRLSDSSSASVTSAQYKIRFEEFKKLLKGLVMKYCRERNRPGEEEEITFKKQGASMTPSHAHLHDEEYQRRVKVFKRYLEGLTCKYFQIRPLAVDREIDFALRYFLAQKKKQDRKAASKEVLGQ